MESRCEIGTLVQRSYNRWAALRIYANLYLMTPGARYRGHVPRCEARWPPPCPASTSPPPPASDTPPPCHSCPASRAASLHYYNIYTTTSNTTISSTGGAPATPTRVGTEASFSQKNIFAKIFIQKIRVFFKIFCQKYFRKNIPPKK